MSVAEESRRVAGELVVVHAGLMPYAEAEELQHALRASVAERSTEAPAEYLVLLEHPPVITMGRSGDMTNLLVSEQVLAERGVGFHHCERGGDITFHGPGQLVGYPVLDLHRHGADVRGYLRRLEAVLIRLLADYGLEAGRVSGFTGVWVGDGKVAAMGIAVRGWVTWHGFALNVNVDLDYFDLICPCGIGDRGVTSMERLLGRRVDMGEVKARLVECFAGEFGHRRIGRASPEEALSAVR